MQSIPKIFLVITDFSVIEDIYAPNEGKQIAKLCMLISLLSSGYDVYISGYNEKINIDDRLLSMKGNILFFNSVEEWNSSRFDLVIIEESSASGYEYIVDKSDLVIAN